MGKPLGGEIEMVERAGDALSEFRILQEPGAVKHWRSRPLAGVIKEKADLM